MMAIVDYGIDSQSTAKLGYFGLAIVMVFRGISLRAVVRFENIALNLV